MGKKAEVIILSDPYRLDTIRYIGPYVVKKHLARHGISTVVIDFFRRFASDDEFFQYLENFISDQTRVIMISSTFLYNRHYMDTQIKNGRGRKDLDWWQTLKDTSLYLWANDNAELSAWFHRLRSLESKHGNRFQIVIGGERLNWIYKLAPHVSEDYALKTADLMIMGKVDNFIGPLVKSLVKGNWARYQSQIQNINGLNFFKADGVMIYDRHVDPVPDSSFDLDDAVLPGEWLPFENVRGCAFSCKYCNYDKGYSNKKSMQRHREEFQKNFDLHGTTGYSFTAECFNDNYQYVKDFHTMSQALPFDIEWNSYARMDIVTKYPDVPDLMLAAGARSLIIGIESLTPHVARAAGRGVNPKRVLELCQRYHDLGEHYGGINLKGLFIVGLPGETPETQMMHESFFETQALFRSVSMWTLEVIPYQEDLDAIFNFAAYSVDPGKYGFEKLSWSPYYWKHKGMDSHQAVELHNLLLAANDRNPYCGNTNQMSFYSALRSSGIDNKTALENFRTPKFAEDIMLARTKQYHAMLLDHWCD